MKGPVEITGICPEESTEDTHSSGIRFTLVWPESDMQPNSISCSCGNFTLDTQSFFKASRACRLDELKNRAVWDTPNTSLCVDLNVKLCSISQVHSN